MQSESGGMNGGDHENPSPDAPSRPRVCIGIPTFKRPNYLCQLLRSLEKLQTRAVITVIVADNDTIGREGMSECRNIVTAGYRFPLLAVESPVRGIAGTRNILVKTALQQGGAGYIAMIDDDSWPELDWLETLLDLIEAEGVDVVRAAMEPHFEQPPEPWLVQTELYRPPITATGRVAQIHAAGNFLARADVFRKVACPWFSPDYALTGGEDDDFFLRLKELGYTFAQTANTIVHERMPATRCTPRWLLDRALMNGSSWARIRMRRRPKGWTPPLEAAKIAAGFVFGALTICLFFWSRARAFRGVYRIYRSLGKVRGLQGKQQQYYS